MKKIVDAGGPEVYLLSMKSPAPHHSIVDLDAQIRGYKRILALDPYIQRLVDPKLLEEAQIWLHEADTIFTR